MHLLIHEENTATLTDRKDTFEELRTQYLRKAGLENESTVAVVDPDTADEVLRHFVERWNTQVNHIEIVNELALTNAGGNEEIRAELFQLASGDNGAIVMAVSVWDQERVETARSSEFAASRAR